MNQRMQSGTTYPVTFFMVLASDHLTPATGKTVTVTLSKNGGTFAAAAGTVTEIGNGWYALAGNATDRNTLGDLLLRATATACDETPAKLVIVPYDPFARVDANVTQVATDAITAAAVKADAVTKIQAGLATPTNITGGTITTVSGNVGGSISGSVSSVSGNVDGSVGGNVAGNVQGDIEGKLLGGGTGTITGTGVRAVDGSGNPVGTAANQATILAKTNLIPAAPASTTNITAATGVVLAAAGLDAVLIEAAITASAALVNDAGTQLTGINARQALAAILSSVAAVLSGAATTAVAVKPAGKPAAADRIDAVVDADGNRSAVSLRVPT